MLERSKNLVARVFGRSGEDHEHTEIDLRTGEPEVQRIGPPLNIEDPDRDRYVDEHETHLGIG